jgi:hypothetical protein
MAPSLGRPLPAHAQRPESIAAVDAHRRIADADRAARRGAELVTDHGNPPVKPYRGGVPANATKLEALARDHGFETKVIETIAGCRVEGYHAARRVGFRATFTRGRADGASWCTPWRYGIVHDPRPVGVNKLTRTGLAGKRAPGVGETRLSILGTPWGVAITHTELNERISS